MYCVQQKMIKMCTALPHATLYITRRTIRAESQIFSLIIPWVMFLYDSWDGSSKIWQYRSVRSLSIITRAKS